MRPDFSKLLVERERIHHADHYHNYRNVKGPKGAWDDDEVGGRESMRIRYNHGYDRKSFNENLNPLKGWLRSCLGKKWDKCYSELRTMFDARSVVNQHILEHLYQYVEVNTKVVDGVVMVLDGYNGSRGYVPLKKRHYNTRWPEYYVCPKDGTLKSMHKPSRRSVVKQQEAEKKAKELAVKRYISDTEVLHFIDGIWYHFDMLPIPEARIVYEKPYGVDIFKTGYQFLGTPNSRREKTWDELNQAERERFGLPRVVGGTARDEFTNNVVYRDQRGVVHLGKNWMNPRRDRIVQTHYHANKKTASKKQLKQAGIV